MSDMDLSDAERAVRDYRKKLVEMPADGITLEAVECEVRALTEALARELVAVALKRTDTDAPEVAVDASRSRWSFAWGSSRGVTRRRWGA
jgi:hypothetical protein